MADLEDLHELACAAGETTYIDPESGYTVFTAVGLRKRGKCCGNGCRHCPYGHMNVKDPIRKRNTVVEPVLLNFAESPSEFAGRARKKAKHAPEQVAVLFFSGGKDSYLALRRLERNDERVVLLCTFSGPDSMVGHQQIPFWEVVVEQAKAMRKNLLAVPLAGGSYTERIAMALKLLPEAGVRPTSLCFGDLHVPYIKEWREKHLRHLLSGDDDEGVPLLRYPVWHATYDDLVQELEKDGAEVRVCSVDDDLCPASARNLVQVGAKYDGELYRRLKELGGIDALGENGEFHSVVYVPGMKRTLFVDRLADEC